jgi:hypothetical protein
MRKAMEVQLEKPISVTFHGQSRYPGEAYHGNAHLKKGQTYEAVKLYHYANNVELELKEFPGKQFSSRLFEQALVGDPIKDALQGATEFLVGKKGDVICDTEKDEIYCKVPGGRVVVDLTSPDLDFFILEVDSERHPFSYYPERHKELMNQSPLVVEAREALKRKSLAMAN